MKATKIAIMAMILLSFASCQKDKDLGIDSDSSFLSKDRGTDDEFILIGQIEIKDAQLIKVFSMDLDKYLETIPVQEDGSFTASVPGGPYVFELFANGIYLGTSDVFVIDENNTNILINF